MHIVMLSSTHPPTDARIFRREAKTLSDAGHKVTILTLANGNFDSKDGIEFIVFPRKKNRFRRVINSRKLRKTALELNADLYIIHDAEILYIGRWLTRRGKKFIYDAHEPYPEFISEKKWVPRLLKPAVKKIVEYEEARGVKHSSGVIVAMKEILQRLSRPNLPTLILRNFPPLSDIVAMTGERENLIIYVGGIMRERFGLEMIEMAKSFAPGEILDGYKLEILGPVFDPEYARRCSAEADKHRGYLHYSGAYVDYKLALERMKKALIGISLIVPTPKYNRTLSSKVFDYMACGAVPVTTWLSPYEGLISENDGPVFIQPGEEKHIQQILADLLKDPVALRQRAELCLKSAREKFNWEPEGKELLKFISKFEKNSD